MRFTKISGPATPETKDTPTVPTPLEMLLDCHARIRHFTQLSRTLAHAQGVSETEIADAARSVYRYFKRALPLHEADENQSLFPRLREVLPLGGLVREAAETMVKQHKAIDELVAELLSVCDTLQRHPDRLPVLARRLQDVTAALAQIFAAHLRLEETVIFPALKSLRPEQVAEILHEMQERRRTPHGAIHLIR